MVLLLAIVGGSGRWAKPAIPLQVKGDALEQVTQVIDSVAAPLEHLQLVVEPFQGLR